MSATVSEGRGTGLPSLDLDVAVSYLIKGPALRVVATYSHTKLDMNDASARPELQLDPARRTGDFLLVLPL